ncbi:hypothetical protein HG530_005011 [Fusarium avenaceum]|nr:hypothetical protein DER45DRAFT_628323 [Fusarium avenaceum]KAI6770382.1 hypothetical protein HG530_005011 [Fusarium avenaceum]
MGLTLVPNDSEMPSKARSVMMPADARGPSAPLITRTGFPKAICMLAESLIADIPTTEHYVFLYNEVDAPQRENLPLSKRPSWSDGSQNIFAPSNIADGNHHHAVIGMGTSRSEATDTPVQIRIGPGGEAKDWHDDRTLSQYLDPYIDELRELRVPFGSAVRIRLRFQLDDSEEHKATSFMSDEVENVVASGCIPPKDWHDSVRLEVSQGDRSYTISLNIRFVEHQNPDPRVKGMTRAEMFNISDIILQEQGPRMINGKRVFIYNYLVKLKHSRGQTVVEYEMIDGLPIRIDRDL